jgi:phosphoglycolate phosphatase
MSYRAIVFDLGGVLLDCEEAHANAVRRVAVQLRLHLGTDTAQQIRGGAYEDFFDRILSLPENAGCQARPPQAALQAYDYYYDEVRRSARLFPGALEVLEAARTLFPFVAIATSSEWRLVDVALRHFGLGGYFDGIISGDHITQKKPAPEAFLVAAWLLGVKPSAMIVVEDSIHGIRGARLARAHVVGIATNNDPQALRAAEAHRVVGSHRELIEHLRELSAARPVFRGNDHRSS